MGLQFISSLLEKFENIGQSTRMVIAPGKRPEVVSFTVPRYTVEISTGNFHDVGEGQKLGAAPLTPCIWVADQLPSGGMRCADLKDWTSQS